ncbi:MAG: hypothetical protein HZC41_22205 [Chloroflexi bacterium]|nr:hypothetical protein [Chloroflexota bacterium]
MDFTKFVSLLSLQALFFPTVSALKNSDIWEGSWTNFEAAEYVGSDKSSIETTKKVMFPYMNRAASKQAAISCWHMNDYESMAMWRLYLSTDKEWIAIQTNFGRLTGCFIFDHENWPVWGGNFNSRPIPVMAGQVEYVDWEKSPSNTDTIKQYFYKGKSFEHEKELRIIAQLHPIIGSFSESRIR